MTDRVNGLRAGADDYLVKPFAMEELVARLQALLRRPGNLLGRQLTFGNVSLETEGRQVFVDGIVRVFPARETAILEILLRRGGNVVPKRLFEDQLFGLSGDVGSNAVEVYVHRLRKMLQDCGATVKIHTVRGVGYLLAACGPPVMGKIHDANGDWHIPLIAVALISVAMAVFGALAGRDRENNG